MNSPIILFLFRPFFKLLLWLGGWKYNISENLPDKAIAICAWHTSNWDFYWFMLCRPFVKKKVLWIGKESLFKFPQGLFFRWMGGRPVIRDKSTNWVDNMKKAIENEHNFFLGMAPEGTRKFTDHWRSGFYYLALESGLPIVPCYLDYKKKEIGLSDPFNLTGDVETDLKVIRSFYSDKTACIPANRSTIEFR